MSGITKQAILVISRLQEQSPRGPICVTENYITVLEDLLTAYQAQAVIINKVKDTIEELKALVAKVPTTIELQTEVTEEVECPECGEEHEVEVSIDQEVPVPQLNNLWADLEKAISDLDYYLLAQELKSAKQ